MIYREILLKSLPGISDERGELRWIEGGTTIPFDIKRIFYMTDVPFGALRGGHAHKRAHQFIIPLAGKFEALLDDGQDKTGYELESSHVGLYVRPMVWCELERFGQGSVCLVLTSEHYDESDYIRDYETFLKEVKK
jgi:dTDP-4-dehydrorhamnose 3,5-epimerase-like enzyme